MFYWLFLPLYNVLNPKHCLTQVLLIVPPPIQCCEPITLFEASFTYCSSPYTTSQTHNIAWRKFYLFFFPHYNVANPWHCLTQVFLILLPPIQCCEPITFLDASFTYYFYPYTMLPTLKIAWCKFYLLFVNIVKRGKGREAQYRLDSSFPNNCCQWLSEKSVIFWVRYFTVAQHF